MMATEEGKVVVYNDGDGDNGDYNGNHHQDEVDEVEVKTMAQVAPKTDAGDNRPIWRGNFSVWWLVGAVYAIWFTAGHGIPYLVRDPSPLFGIHLVNACLVTWLCLANLFHTPSHGPTYRPVHRVLGYLALITGTLSTLFGLLTVWYERYGGVTAFAIAITIGGILQVLLQVLAIHFIRRSKKSKNNSKSDVRRHIIYNHLAFYAGCLIPGILRLPSLLHLTQPIAYWDTFAWLFPLVLGALALQAKFRNFWI